MTSLRPSHGTLPGASPTASVELYAHGTLGRRSLRELERQSRLSGLTKTGRTRLGFESRVFGLRV